MTEYVLGIATLFIPLFLLGFILQPLQSKLRKHVRERNRAKYQPLVSTSVGGGSFLGQQSGAAYRIHRS